jgi:hypothetical protein
MKTGGQVHRHIEVCSPFLARNPRKEGGFSRTRRRGGSEAKNAIDDNTRSSAF